MKFAFICFGGDEMRLTDKEMQIMAVLWDNGTPMTASEIIVASENRTWKENSIYIIMNTLLRKGAVILAYLKPTTTKTARAYTSALTSEEYMVKYVGSIKQTGVNISIPTFVERLMKTEGK
jgi:BlaI family penicillinase repressor